jgi:hypothetical protein
MGRAQKLLSVKNNDSMGENETKENISNGDKKIRRRLSLVEIVTTLTLLFTVLNSTIISPCQMKRQFNAQAKRQDWVALYRAKYDSALNVASRITATAHTNAASFQGDFNHFRQLYYRDIAESCEDSNLTYAATRFLLLYENDFLPDKDSIVLPDLQNKGKAFINLCNKYILHKDSLARK